MHYPYPMHLLVASLAVLFLLAGLISFAARGVSTIVFWSLAAGCVIASWKMRPQPERVSENTAPGSAAAPPSAPGTPTSAVFGPGDAHPDSPA